LWLPSLVQPGKKETMKFSIEVGEEKKHRIEYQFNQLLGRLVIKSNQHEVKRRVRWFNEPVKETHSLRVDVGEPLTVRIDKERHRFLGAKYLVFLNERLLKCYEGI